MTLETISEHRCFGGVQGFYRHNSVATATAMRFSVYKPPQAGSGRVPVLWFLAGLTCTEENFTVKAGAQRYAAEHGLMLVAPDTSPRGAGVPDDPAYDFGQGAGFYLDATAEPWAKNFLMHSYVVGDLPTVLFDNFPARQEAQGIFGHSMGGHGALTIALKHPEIFRSVSAFAPIVAPLQVPWGKKAFQGYLGGDRLAARRYDATALIEDGARFPGRILIDQGEADQFLAEQLRPELFAAACEKAGQEVELRRQRGYDHSYYFIASFVGDHIAHHAAALNRG
jgi:S-formylglutathione hydrolase